ncbi:hypothetical protein V6N13_017246 [Hibiscus sabdariffa]
MWWDDPIQSTILAPCPAEQSWIPPSGEIVKFSVDGATTSDKATCGGVLASSDSEGAQTLQDCKMDRPSSANCGIGC